MKGLQHGFVARLRFTGMPQFRTESGEYADLPLETWATGIPMDALCIAQCFALAGYDDQAGLLVPPSALTSAHGLRPWLASHCPRHQVEANPAPSAHPAAIGSAVQRALWADGLALVQLQPSRGGSVRRWALITGVEWRAHGQGNDEIKSLLLLDPAEPWVWACGHNARLSLAAQSWGPGRARFRWVSLGGGLQPVCIAGLVTMVPACARSLET